MKITFDEIKNSNPLLIMYSAGVGGEFVTAALSNASKQFHTSPHKIITERNRFSTRCPIDFFTNWSNPDDPETWVNPIFEKTENNVRYILKDHPMCYLPKFYKRHMPDVSIAYIAPFTESNYFSKLLFLKTSIKINTPIDDTFILTNVNGNIPVGRIQHIVNWANRHPEVWKHELHSINTVLSNGGVIDNILHQPNLHKYIAEHQAVIQNDIDSVFPIVKKNISNATLINSDSLTVDGAEFWKSIKLIVKDLDLDAAIANTREWAQHNKELINNYER